MGTTLVALLFAGSRVGLAHVGDSRCYLLRDGELTQITHDHTYVQALVDEGKISEAEADTHPRRSVITNVLDGRSDVEPDLSVREARVGDRYLVCSDGLTGPVNSLETLQEALSIADPQGAVDRLVQLALRGGGPDNVTVIVADVLESDDRDPTPVVAGAAAEAPQDAPPGIADSAASRARVAEGRDTAPPARTRSTPTVRKRRTALTLGVLMLLLIAGGLVTWSYVASQFYVGLDEDQVVIYRGVRGSVAGVDLAGVHERTELHTDRLSPLEKDRLSDGIVANDESDARTIVQRLIAKACPTPKPTPVAATPSPNPSPAPAPSPTPCP
jgi:protein phosphatase